MLTCTFDHKGSVELQFREILGITASASFGAAIAITLGLSVAGYLWIGTALLALVFALAVSLLIFYLGRLKGMSTSTLIQRYPATESPNVMAMAAPKLELAVMPRV